MYHLDNTSGVPEMPEPKDTQTISTRWFGESLEQGGISWPGADWFNIIQAELLNILARAELEPGKHEFDQLATAIEKLSSVLETKINQPDGFSFVGRCPDIATLRTLEPRFPGQAIILERAVTDGPVLNEIITHNPAPQETDDDGYSRWVTPSGNVWEAQTALGLNIFLAGVSANTHNLAECLNRVVKDKVSRVIARGYVAGGVGSAIRIPALPRSDGSTVYVMNEQVRIPTFLAVYASDGLILDWSNFTTATALVVDNEFPGLTNAMMFLNNGPGWGAGSGASSSHNSGGIFLNGALIKGPGRDNTQYPGIRYGNVTPGFAHCRNGKIIGGRVTGFKSGLKLGYVDTYMPEFIDIHLVKNKYAIETDYGTDANGNIIFTNSGETIRVIRCILGDNSSHPVYRNDRGHHLRLLDCNIDYNNGDLVHCSPYNLGETVIFGGWLEGNEGLFLNCPVRAIADGENSLWITGAPKIYLNRSVNEAFYGVRELVFGDTDRTVLHVDASIFAKGPYVNGPYGAFKSPNPANKALIEFDFPRSMATYRFLPSYDHRINSVLAFNGTEGADVNTTKETGYFFVTKTGEAQVKFGGAGDRDEHDDYIPVLITTTSPTDVVQLYYSKPINTGEQRKKLSATCSVKVGDATGSVNVRACARVVSRVDRKANSTTYVVSDTEVHTVNLGTTQNITTALTKEGITVTKNDFMGTYPLEVDLVGGLFAYMGLLYTGYVGTIMVKLPAWWFAGSKMTNGYRIAS